MRSDYAHSVETFTIQLCLRVGDMYVRYGHSTHVHETNLLSSIVSTVRARSKSTIFEVTKFSYACNKQIEFSYCTLN